MTTILVLTTFAIFVLYGLITKKKAGRYVVQTAPAAKTCFRNGRPILAGYEVPEHLYFHQGHTWALKESAALVRVGIDDFAAKLIGEAQEISLPQRGQWIRQGQTIWTFRVNGELVEMVSPIEGTVDDVNDNVIRHPERLTMDPYGESWLMTVLSPDVKTNLRNLLSGSMARNFAIDSATRLAAYIPGSKADLRLAQDGGNARYDIAKHLPSDKYLEITKEFFLT